jgi:hypothetical protein
MSATYRRGRKPDSRALKLLKGGVLRDYHTHEPVYPAERPVCPSRLANDALAVAAFGKLVDQLAPAKVINASHSEAIAIVALSIANLTRAQHELEAIRAGTIPMTRDKQLALERRLDSLQSAHMKHLAEFGWTPMSSARVRTLDAASGSSGPAPFADFLTRKRKIP